MPKNDDAVLQCCQSISSKLWCCTLLSVSKEFLANTLDSFDTQVVVVYDQNLLCPRALAVCEARGSSLHGAHGSGRSP